MSKKQYFSCAKIHFFAQNTFLECARLVLSCGADPDMLVLALLAIASGWCRGDKEETVGLHSFPEVPM